MASARGRRGSNYDVFLSFRGPDTRNSFVDCLYEHMMLTGILAFVDNERLHVGEVIGEELMHVIDHSKICMPIFSRSYASSKWCMLELERIMMARSGQEVLPVFYDVSPDDVKLRTRLYRDDLDALEKEHGIDIVDQWRKCLKEVCKIKGWNLEESKRQGKLIKEIVQEVLYKTKKRYKNIPDQIVGIEGQVEEVTELLDGRIDYVRFVVIHGMGGIGKTTLAKFIFNMVSSEFQGCSFLSNVRESSKGNGIVKLQEQILNDINRMSVSIYDLDDGINEISERCSNKKVLLILDDVNDKDQIRKLAGKFDWFGKGSRIIITTRDSNVILINDVGGKNQQSKIEEEDVRGDIFHYEMQEMNRQHATTLFKRHALGNDENSFDDDHLLQKIVVTAGGLPLALEVVGSHLFGKTKAVWRETLRKLERAPHQKVQNALMISYESLEDEEKEIFLDIACFFQGIKKRLPMYVWESLDLYPVSGMNALSHKSLIKFVDGEVIWMHDQLRDLGREIVRKDGKTSRIWKNEEALRMILDRKGTNDVVLVDLGDLSEGCEFKKSGFKELTNLRTLRLSGGNLQGDFGDCFPQLRYLEWTSFPSNFRAQNFNLPNLAVLKFTKTDIDEGWTGWNRLLGSKLKVLEISGCGGLTRTPDLSAFLGLEMLILRFCTWLTEIDDSIGKLQQLTDFEIHRSPNLKGLPDSLLLLKRIVRISVSGIMYTEYPVKFHLPIFFDDLKSLCHLAFEDVGLESLPKGIGRLKLLKHLSLEGCSQLTSLPESVCELESLVKLNLRRTGLTSFSGQIENMKELKVLDMSETNIRMLPKGIGSLAKLEELILFACESLEQIPSEIGNLFTLRVLKLFGTSIVELPSTVSGLSHLEHLDMHSCWKLRKVEQLPVSLSHLRLPYFSLQVAPDLSNLVNLIDLSLFNNYRVFNVGGIPIIDSTRFRSLDFAWIERMCRLKRLEIGAPVDIINSLEVDWNSLSWVRLHIYCSKAQSLSQLPPTLSELFLYKFQDTILQMSLYPNLKNLVHLSIVESLTEEIELRGLEVLRNLKTITVGNCKSLMKLSLLSWPKKINELTMMHCPRLVEVCGLERFESLRKLWFHWCPLLPRVPDFTNMVKIKFFRMTHCNSMESMPALPRTKHPFKLHVADCGKVRDFDGPHHLYGDAATQLGNASVF